MRDISAFIDLLPLFFRLHPNKGACRARGAFLLAYFFAEAVILRAFDRPATMQ